MGIKTELSPDGSPKPVTTVLGWAIISPDNENAILEFKDICFAMNDIGGAIKCTKGRLTTFRRCSFINTLMTVKGDDDLAFPERLVDQLGTPNVVFENCCS